MCNFSHIRTALSNPQSVTERRPAADWCRICWDQALFIRGGGVFWTRPTHPTLDPPGQLLTHSEPPPPLIILWGAFFVNQIEAKALSRVGHPQRVTHKKIPQHQGLNQGSLELQLSSLTSGLPTSFDSIVQQRVHRFNMLSKKSPPCKNCHLHTCHLHNDTTERGPSKQPDKAPVTKERRCGRSPTQKTVRIIRGGVPEL